MQMQAIFNSNAKHGVPNLLSKSPFVLDADDSYDVFVFRRLLEASMKLGLWGGFVGQA